MKSFKNSILTAIVVGIGFMLQIPSALAGVDLPTEDCGLGPTNTCLEFGDFTVYSLPLLQEYQSNSSTALYDSLQGLDLKFRISEAEIWVVNNNGSGDGDQGTGTLIDDPYVSAQGDTNPVTPPTQDPNVEDNLLFLMTSTDLTGQFEVPSDPAGGPADDNLLQPDSTVVNTETYVYHDTSVNDINDYLNANGTAGDGCYTELNGCLPLWDADVGALRDALGEGDLAFFFSNNETGDTGGLEGQDLNAWARVCLSDTDGAKDTVCFTLDGTSPDDASHPLLPEQWDDQVAGQSDILPEEEDRWVHVHSDLCVLNSGQVLLGACNDQDPPVPTSAGRTVNQSLGQNEATFAVVNLELSDLVKDPTSGYDVMTIDFRMAYLNNGGDWLTMGTVNVAREVPEPGTLFLLGLGLVGFGVRRLKQH